MPDNFNVETQVSAKKIHICCECKGRIKPGERYHRFVGNWEGDFYSYKMCSVCRDIMNGANRDADHDEYVQFEGLLEHLQEIDTQEQLTRFRENQQLRRDN